MLNNQHIHIPNVGWFFRVVILIWLIFWHIEKIVCLSVPIHNLCVKILFIFSNVHASCFILFMERIRNMIAVHWKYRTGLTCSDIQVSKSVTEGGPTWLVGLDVSVKRFEKKTTYH